MHPHAIYFHAFNSFNERIGPARFKKILGYFGTLEKAWKNGHVDSFISSGLEEDLANEIAIQRPHFNLEKELEKLSEENIKILTILDKNYPARLKEIYDPPYIIYMKGELKPEDEFSIAIVGTRRLSIYGQQAAEKISSELAQAGVTIISGLAQGIDTIAHLSALENNSRTIGVLGSSIKKKEIFPMSNSHLAEKISQGRGAILSEYPPGSFPLKHHFPTRNRIVSGLSLGTVVIEAPEKSGALITARLALEQNREVFAVPGPIFSNNSSGTNQLIKMGAKLVSNAQDILGELNLENLTQKIEARQISPATLEEEIIIKTISREPIAIDKIAQITKLNIIIVNSTLALMEMKGMVRNMGGMQFVIGR